MAARVGAWLLALVGVLAGCAASGPASPEPAPAPADATPERDPPAEVDVEAAPEVLPASERECYPPGEAPPRSLLDPPPPRAPDGVATTPCVKCGDPLWPTWRDCPRCGWSREDG